MFLRPDFLDISGCVAGGGVVDPSEYFDVTARVAVLGFADDDVRFGQNQMFLSVNIPGLGKEMFKDGLHAGLDMVRDEDGFGSILRLELAGLFSGFRGIRGGAAGKG